VENLIAGRFAHNNEISFGEIWDELRKPPVGLMKCPGSIFLMALLLKDYADNNFYLRDYNSNTSSLTGERLCSLIVAVVKNLPQARDNFIVKQTAEHLKFCKLTADIFNLRKEDINSIDDTSKCIKALLAQSRYPLWILTYLLDDKNSTAYKSELVDALNLFCEFINPPPGRDITKIANEIFDICDTSPAIVDEFKKLLRPKNFKAGMEIHLKKNHPEFRKILRRLKISDDEAFSLLNGKVFNSLIFHTATDFTLAAEIVKRNARPFKKFFDNQFDTFAKSVTSFVDGVPDSQILESVFKDMPAGIFFMTREDFSSQLKNLLNKINRMNITALAKKDKCSEDFRSYFCGDLRLIVDDDNLRAILRKHAGSDVYSWFTKKKICEVHIRAFAKKNYTKNSCQPSARLFVI
ncbi:MAG: hypothetical protein IJT57_04235, partial [Selenomonadaceae bacterium]|nr:hypothetical protein [Selenomonadaceae bacterium]